MAPRFAKRPVAGGTRFYPTYLSMMIHATKIQNAKSEKIP